MELAHPDGKRLGTVVLPDLSGESFSAQWSQRQCPAATAEMVRESSGLMLLLHSTHMDQPVRLCERAALAATLPGASTSGSQQKASEEATTWSPELAGTDVQLVDLLQFMRFHLGENVSPLRLAIGISAWDLVQRLSPGEWLKERLPLLHQYLGANPELFTVRLYGISAQGGDYEKSGDDLLMKPKASERIQIVGEGCEPHDVTAPIAWLLST